MNSGGSGLRVISSSMAAWTAGGASLASPSRASASEVK